MPALPKPGDVAWTRSRYIYRLLEVLGPLTRKELCRVLGVNRMQHGLESYLISCDKCGFMLAEDDAGRLSAWRVV